MSKFFKVKIMFQMTTVTLSCNIKIITNSIHLIITSKPNLSKIQKSKKQKITMIQNQIKQCLTTAKSNDQIERRLSQSILNDHKKSAAMV